MPTIKIIAEPTEVFAGQVVKLKITLEDHANAQQSDRLIGTFNDGDEFKIRFISEDTYHHSESAPITFIPNRKNFDTFWDTKNISAIRYHYDTVLVKKKGTENFISYKNFDLYDEEPYISVNPPLTNTIISKSHAPQPTDDQALWVAIRNRTKAVNFDRYTLFIQNLFCDSRPEKIITNSSSCIKDNSDKLKHAVDRIKDGKADLGINAADSYTVLRLATQVFLLLESGVVLEEKDHRGTLFEEDQERIRLDDAGANFDSVKGKLQNYLGGTQNGLPYLHRILESLLGTYDTDTWEGKLAYCNTILQHRFTCPGMLELIWSYWMEECMLVQSMNAIALRFQNRRSGGKRDPLAHLEIDPLHGLNNLLWGYIQNEHNRLSLSRRSYEYAHHYGISLHGKAVPTLRSADTRSKFLEGFHNVLNRAADFYRQNANTQINADAFPLLNAIKQVHLCLAEGAHNQFGDLPWTARIEMLIEQWILARPQMREFLHQRAMVPYNEDWMGRVDAMKTLQGWTDTSATHFHELAIFGEQLILSLRYGNWSGVNNAEQARNWAIYWKPEIQSYINSYQIATGVDLSAKLLDGKQVDSTPPSKHLLRKLQQQQRRALAA